MRNLDRIYANLSLDARLDAIDELIVGAVVKECKGEPKGDEREQIQQILSAMPQDQAPQFRQICLERKEKWENFEQLYLLIELYYKERILELRKSTMELSIIDVLNFFILAKFVYRLHKNEEIDNSDIIDLAIIFAIRDDLDKDSYNWDKEKVMSVWDEIVRMETNDALLFNKEEYKELFEIERKLEDLFKQEDEAIDDVRFDEIEAEAARLMKDKVELLPISKMVLDVLENLWDEQNILLKELRNLIKGNEKLLMCLEDTSRPLSEIIYSDIIDSFIKNADERFYRLHKKVCEALICKGCHNLGSN